MCGPRNIFSPLPQAQKNPIWAQKRLKVTLKLGGNQKAEKKRTWKIKFVQLHKETQHSK